MSVPILERGPFDIDARHEKTDLKVVVVVIPKEGLAGWGPANPSLGMTPTLKYYSTAFIDYPYPLILSCLFICDINLSLPLLLRDRQG